MKYLIEEFFNKNFTKNKNFKRLKKEIIQKSIHIITFFILSFGLSYLFYENIINFLIKVLKDNSVKLFHLSLFEVFFLRINISLYSAVFFSTPITLYIIFKFIKDILKNIEKKAFSIFIFSFCLIFYLSFFLVYYIEIPFLIKYILLSNYTKELYINLTLFINQFIFIIFINILLMFIPLIFYIIYKFKLIKYKFLRKNRKIFYFLSFLISAFFTPPDIIYQLILGFIFCILFEILTYLVKKQELKSKSNFTK